MSNRRNFLVLMAGTASLGVLSSIGGKGVVSPSYAEEDCDVSNSTLETAVKEGFKTINNVVSVVTGALSEVKSGSESALESLSDNLTTASNDQAAFWSNPNNFARFVRGAAVNEQTRAAQALKGRFSDKQIADAFDKALRNLKANNISAIENDPIIGSVVKAGYAAASTKLKEVSAQRKKIQPLQNQLRTVVGLRVEADAIKLKKESKITNADLQEFSKLYPALAPNLKKAIDFKVQPGLPGPGKLPGVKPPGGIQLPGKPGEQVKPISKLINQLSLDTDNAISATSTSNKNRFDVYAENIDRRLLAMNTQMSEEGDLTLVDRLLGIEKANAIEPVVTVLLIVAGLFVLSLAVTAISDALKNEACKELKLKQQQAAAVAACERRAADTRTKRIAKENGNYRKCRSDLGIFRLLCNPGHIAAIAAIEVAYWIDVNACS